MEKDQLEISVVLSNERELTSVEYYNLEIIKRINCSLVQSMIKSHQN